MNICFSKVVLLWPHLAIDTLQHKHATWDEGEMSQGTVMVEGVWQYAALAT